MGRTPNVVPQVSRTLKRRIKWLTVSRVSGSENAVKDSIRSAKQVAQSHKCQSFESASREAEMESLWSARKMALWASLAVRPEGTQIWSTDVAVPLSRMAELIGTLWRFSLQSRADESRHIKAESRETGPVQQRPGPCRRR